MTATRFRLATATLVAVISACGKSESTGPVNPPPELSIVALQVTTTVSGDTTLTEGGVTTSLVARAEREDRSTMEVTTSSEVRWTSSDLSLATVSTSGVVKPLKPGSVTITASFRGVSGSISIRIKPDGIPWAELPWTLQESRDYVKSILEGRGRVWRWADDAFPLKIWFDAEARRRGLTDVFAFWDQVKKLEYILVEDSASAQITVAFTAGIYDPDALEPICGKTGWDVDAKDVVFHSAIRLAPDGVCTKNGDQGRWLLIHEAGHAIGFFRHPPGCENIMSVCRLPKPPIWGKDFMDGLYSKAVQPGLKPIG